MKWRNNKTANIKIKEDDAKLVESDDLQGVALCPLQEINGY